MIDTQDITDLQKMRDKYQGAASAIAEEKTRALGDVETRYQQALQDLENKRKAMLAQVERRSQADAAKVGQFLDQLNSFLSTLGATEFAPTPTEPKPVDSSV